MARDDKFVNCSPVENFRSLVRPQRKREGQKISAIIQIVVFHASPTSADSYTAVIPIP